MQSLSQTVSLAYDDDGSGPALVFLHGGWLSGTSWRLQRDRFSSDNRVVVPDLRGHGRTGPTEARRYSIDLFAEDLDALLDRLGIDRAVICGISLGSMVAQSYLDAHPERVAGVVLAGAVRTFPPVPIPPMIKYAMTPVFPLGTSLAFADTAPTFRALLANVRAMTGGRWLARDPAVRAEALDTVGEVSPREFWKVFRALYTFEPPELEGTTVPGLVVYGENEAEPVKGQSRALARALDAETVSIPGAAHLANQDNPGAFDEALAGFLSGIESE